jgi:hypothetical protein
MKIQSYYKKLNKQTSAVFEASLQNPQLLARVHSAASELDQLALLTVDSDERSMLRTVCAQLETSCLCASYGLYHPAMALLRLCLELGIGAIHFSSNKLAQREWLANGDLSWSVINSFEDGVLSKRFSKAFFPELVEQVTEIRERANNTYGVLSEYVHGNSDTWSDKGLALTLSEERLEKYAKAAAEVVEILKFSYCVRHLKFFDASDVDGAHEAFSDLLHIDAIREYLGGPKVIK